MSNNKQEKSEENFEEDIVNKSESKGSPSEGILSNIDVLLNADQEIADHSFEKNFEEDIYNESSLSEGILAKFNSDISDIVRIKILKEPKYPRKRPPKTCSYCGVSVKNLKRHLERVQCNIPEEERTNDNKKPKYPKNPKKRPPKVPCPKCGKNVLSDHLSNHLEWVHGPPKTCSYCGVSVKNLKRHLEKVQCNIPEEERTNKDTVQCHICSKTLKKDSFRIHLKLSHGEGKKFSCDQCGYKTNIKHNLFLHTKRVHEKRALKEPCPQCNKNCVNLEAHIATYHTSVF